MTYYASDRSLSLETRGAAAALLSVGKTTFTVQDIRDAGASKATAYRILGELRANGYVEKGGGHTWQWLKSYPVSGNPEIRKTGIHAHVLDHDLDTSSKRSAALSDFPENEHDFNHSSDDGPDLSDELTQTTLIGLPEPPTPGSAAPPSPAKARAPRKPKATPEQAAIRQALRDAAGWGPSAKANAQAAENGDALMALDPRATPERITRFARRYFPRHSPVARAAAARQDTVSHPTPGQVLQFWPGFQEWEQAQIAAAARQAEEQRPPERQEITPEQRAENRRILQEAMRSYGLDMAPAARPAMMAAPRRAT
jgi:hypothetical protein